MWCEARVLNQFFVISLLFFYYGNAQSDTLALYSKVIHGKFPNGLTYYICPNPYPKKKVSLYLAVNVGSIVEKEKEQGFAHFVEHMAFNGTKHFPKNTLIDFLRALGARFGPDANAITTFDESVYMLHVPIDQPQNLDKAFLVLEDWIHHVHFHHHEVEKEKGVILEEWRMRMGPFERFQKEFIPALFNHSLYSKRLPIGDLDLIQHVKPSELKSFYTHWYHPSLMAIIVVGDIDPKKAEKYLKQHFESLKPFHASPPERVEVTIPENPEPNVVVRADKEFPFTWIYCSIRRPFRPVRTKADLRNHLLDQIIVYLLNRRYEEVLFEEDLPLSRVEFLKEHVIRPYEFFSWYAYISGEEIERSLAALWKEAVRVYQHGFHPSELEGAKRYLLEQYRAFVEKPMESKQIADTLVKHFFMNQQFGEPEVTYQLVETFLNEIDEKVVWDYYRQQVFLKKNRTIVIGVSGAPSTVSLLSEERILAVMDSVEQLELAPYEERLTVADLVEERLVPHLSVKERKELKHGVKQVVFQNNMKVYLFKNASVSGEVLLMGRAPGGRSLYPPEQDLNLYFADEIAFESGIKQFSGADIKKIMQEKGIQVVFDIQDYWEAFKVTASRENLREALQILYAYITSVRQDSNFVFKYLKSKKAVYQHYSEHPLAYFFIEFLEDLYQHHPRFLLPPEIPKPFYFDQVTFPDVYRRFQERYRYINDFDIVVVGDFSEDTLLTLLSAYLGNLPFHEGLKEEVVDMGFRMREGSHRKVFYKGQAPVATVAIVLHDHFAQNTLSERIKLSILEEIMKRRLINHLREEVGGTYTISTQLDVEKRPYSYYGYLFHFSCHPDRVDSLIHLLHQDFEDLVLNGPSEEEVNLAKMQLLKEYEENMQKNSYIVEQMVHTIWNHELIEDLFEYPSQLKALNAEEIHHAAQHYLNTVNRLEYILLPEQHVQSKKH